MCANAKRVCVLEIPGEDKFLVLTGGNFNSAGTAFSNVNAYRAKDPDKYRQGKKLSTNVAGSKGLDKRWCVSFETHQALNSYHILLVKHLNRRGSLY